MTKREAMDFNRRMDSLASVGITYDDVYALRRISMTLHAMSRMAEAEIAFHK
jgi:hypothetical protein